jgi:hypothetical protein
METIQRCGKPEESCIYRVNKICLENRRRYNECKNGGKYQKPGGERQKKLDELVKEYRGY